MNYLIEASRSDLDSSCNFTCSPWSGSCTCFAGSTYDSCPINTPCSTLCIAQICTPVQVVPSGSGI